MKIIQDSKIEVVKSLSNVLVDTANREVQINILNKIYLILTKYTGAPDIYQIETSSYNYYEDFIYSIHDSISKENWKATVEWIDSLDRHHNIFNRDHSSLQWWQLGDTYEAISRL